MAEFDYIARNAQGALTKGTLEAGDRAAAIRDLEARRFVPIRITPTPTAGNATSASSPAKAKAQDATQQAQLTSLPLPQLFLFTEQLAHLLSAGMTLNEGLNILVGRLQQPRLKALAAALHQGLIDGRSLSRTMADYPGIFSSLYVNMVSAGEASGSLSQILRRLVTHLDGIKSLREKVQQALVYPAVLVVAGIGLIIVFIVKMVPQLTGFFASTGQTLPAPTRLLLAVNDLLVGYWWVGVLGGAALYGLWRTFTQTTEGRLRWDRFMWHFPAFSRIPRYRFYAQFARTLSTLAENGVTLLKALELLEDISGNQWVRGQMVEVRRMVVEGTSLSNAFRHQKLFPPLFLDMMAVGEQTGRFSETMGMIADVYERDLDKQVRFVTSLIPPLVIILIALVVGMVVFGVLSAVFNLTTGLTPGRR